MFLLFQSVYKVISGQNAGQISNDFSIAEQHVLHYFYIEERFVRVGLELKNKRSLHGCKYYNFKRIKHSFKKCNVGLLFWSRLFSAAATAPANCCFYAPRLSHDLSGSKKIMIFLLPKIFNSTNYREQFLTLGTYILKLLSKWAQYI